MKQQQLPRGQHLFSCNVWDPNNSNEAPGFIIIAAKTETEAAKKALDACKKQREYDKQCDLVQVTRSLWAIVTENVVVASDNGKKSLVSSIKSFGPDAQFIEVRPYSVGEFLREI